MIYVIPDTHLRHENKKNWIERHNIWNGKKILVLILFSHCPKFNHGCDINFHGHQHNLAIYNDKRLYLPLPLEYKFALKNKQPTLSTKIFSTASAKKFFAVKGASYNFSVKISRRFKGN